jgi:catechol 2,3-dioxygenase-like lactoylglutathione lyase family enzyme
MKLVFLTDKLKQLLVLLITSFALSQAVADEPLPTEESGKGFTVEGHAFIALQVEDDAAAVEWYRSVFGLEEVNHLESPNGIASVRILDGDGLSVELIDHGNATPGPTGYQHGLFKAGFHVDDIDAALAWLVERGVDAGIGIFTDQALQVRSFVFRDPWGNRLQIFEPCGEVCE